MNASDAPTTLPKCATPFQMVTRQAFLFRSNVYCNDIIAVATLVLTFMVLKRLKMKSCFSRSTHVLIWISLLITNSHEFIYGYIQNWSLYRSFVYSTDPCNIMFTEYECFPLYTCNIFIRLLLLFNNCALTIDRLLTVLIPCLPSTYSRGVVLFLITLATAFIVCGHLTSDGPNDALQSNCFQRMNRNIDDLKFQVLSYFIPCAICLGLTIVTWLFSWRSLRDKKFELDVQFSKRVNLNSAIVISLILVFQTIALGFYSISTIHLLNIYSEIDKEFGTNIVLWLYTYPWAALSLPAGILMSTSFITMRRKQQIGVLTAENQNENQDSYFIKLNQSWGSRLDSKRNSQVIPVE